MAIHQVRISGIHEYYIGILPVDPSNSYRLVLKQSNCPLNVHQKVRNNQNVPRYQKCPG